MGDIARLLVLVLPGMARWQRWKEEMMMQTNLPTEEQLRDATSQQLDAWAAVLVMGWSFERFPRFVTVNERPMYRYYWSMAKATDTWSLPSFSLDAEDALRLMHKLATEKKAQGEGLLWWMTLEPDGLWLVQMLDYASDGYEWAVEDRSDWLPTAICLAAIRYRLQAGEFTEAQLASLALFNEQTQVGP